MKAGLICTWLDFQRGACLSGTWAIRAFSRAVEVAQLSAPVRWASSALWFPQRLEFEKKIRSEKAWAKFNLLTGCSFRAVWHCTRRRSQALPKWWELHAKPSGFPFSQSCFPCEFVRKWSLSWGKQIVLRPSSFRIWKKKPNRLKAKNFSGLKF